MVTELVFCVSQMPRLCVWVIGFLSWTCTSPCRSLMFPSQDSRRGSALGDPLVTPFSWGTQSSGSIPAPPILNGYGWFFYKRLLDPIWANIFPGIWNFQERAREWGSYACSPNKWRRVTCCWVLAVIWHTLLSFLKYLMKFISDTIWLCMNIFLDYGLNFLNRYSISGPKKLSSCWVLGIKFFIILPYPNVLSPHLFEILAILSSLSSLFLALTFLFSIVVNYFINSQSFVIFLPCTLGLIFLFNF